MLGMIGLGKMGYNMALRLLNKKDNKKEKILVYNRTPEKIKEISKKGATPSYSFEEFFNKLKQPRIIWLMVPHESVSEVLKKIKPYMKKGDILVDGGNSYFKDSIKRYKEMKKIGVKFLDVGVSGGLKGAKTGYSMMIGGDKDAYKKVEPLIKKMCVKNGYAFFGEPGSGHYVKMIHNAIEYGMMQSIGEGFDLAKNGYYKNIDLKKLADVWSNGTIIQGFLMDMTRNGLIRHNNLEKIDGYVPESGEARWAVKTAKEHKVRLGAINYSLNERIKSKKNKNFSNKLVAVIRDEFGGHGVKKK